MRDVDAADVLRAGEILSDDVSDVDNYIHAM
jgi:hypothetical protein